MMNYCFKLIVLTGLVFLSGCLPAQDLLQTVPTGSKGSDVLVSGDIIHIKDAPFSHQDDFVFSDASHAVVELNYVMGQDVASEVITTVRIEDISEFPIAYEIRGDADTVFARQGDYFLQVKVLQGISDDTFVGDLINEFFTPISGVGEVVQVEVTGLELCSREGAGGFCTDKQR